MRLVLIVLVLALVSACPAGAAVDTVRAGAFVLLKEPRLPPADALRSRLETRLDGRLKIDAMESDGQQVILLRVHGGTVMIGLIDAPMPPGEIQPRCENAWYWRSACEATAQHRAHVYLSVLGTDLDTLDASLLLTDVAAVLMDDNAIASDWGSSLQSREAFLRQSDHASRGRPPVWLWVDFRVSTEPGKGFSLSTHGMEEFGLREIEARDVNRPGRDVFTLFIGMAAYLIEKGPVIQDGDTIGDSPALNIRVKQGPSYWRDGATVYRVVFPAD